MSVNNSLQGRNDKKPLPFSVAIRQTQWQELISNTLGEKKRILRFVSDVSSVVGVNPGLQECDPGTVLTAALLGETLNLAPSPQLGYYYMVPYDDKKRGCKVAQFQIGYKGLLQLAIRSGYYRKIVVLPIKEGELVRWNPMEEEIVVNLIDDEDKREATPTIGYYAMFEYVGGTFRKAMYWSRAKMEQHADRYSKAFSLSAYRKLLAGEIPEKDLWKFSSFWYKDFDVMACKTMLRQLLSKWGIMSIELQTAFNADENAVNVDLTPNYLEPEKGDIPSLQDPETGDNGPAAGNPDDQEQLPQELPAGLFD